MRHHQLAKIRRVASFGVLSFLSCVLSVCPALAQVQSAGAQVPTSKHPASDQKIPTAESTGKPIATPQMVAWLTKLIHNNLPETYEDDRKWNQQKEVWNGIKLRREGLKIETKRKKKMVNAGTWTRYKISFVDPDKNVKIHFNRLEVLPSGRIAFSVTVDAALDVFGRLSQWVRDVQMISLSANADAACRLTLEGNVGIQMNFTKFIPDVALEPIIERAHVELTYYRVRRISQVGGDFAKVLGKGLRGTIDNKVEDLNGKLVDKINTQLEKRKEKLSFSATEWVKGKLPLPSKSKDS